ncbi:MAG TPA: endonuclease/exonuclease/phosphatase family protein [Pilimelia sp.]|nr:endonuclease/exonuclease/phosphatase family protein [Pilimelia sp.]
MSDVRVLPTRRTATACWLLLAPGVAWAVVRVAGLERGPLVQLLAFTPYVAAWSVLPPVVALFARRWRAAAVAGAAAVALLGCVVPRVHTDPDPGPRTGSPLRVLTANLLGGGVAAGALVDLVRRERVDALALQEFTPEMGAELRGRGLARDLPFAVTGKDSALYSRHPLRDTGVRENPGPFQQAYGTVERPGAAPVYVESVHPMSPYAVSVLSDWRADLAAQTPADPGGQVRVLAGDFNATLDHAPLRRLLRTGYRDAAATVGAGLAGTWGPYDGDPIPPVTIDHVLVDRRVGVRAVRVYPLPGGDHRAVLAELVLPGPQS